MSWPAVQQVVPLRLPPRERVVLLCLADAKNHITSRCFPSVDYIAEWCCISAASVRSATDELVRLGLIAKTRRQTSSEFVLRISDSQILADSSPDSSDQIARIQRTDSQNLATNLGSNQRREPKTRTKAPQAVPDAFVLPVGIPRDAWDGYMQMRQSQRKALTPHAKELATAKLLRWKDEGFDVGEILNESIMNCWQGLFKPKTGGSTNGANQHKSAVSPAAKRQQESDDAIRQAGIAAGWITPPDAHEASESGISKPNSDRGHGDGLSAKVGGTGGEVWNGDFHGRTLEGHLGR